MRNSGFARGNRDKVLNILKLLDYQKFHLMV